MKNLKTIIFTPMLAALLVMPLTGCDDNTAENAGEKIDNAVRDTGNRVEDACEDIKESVNAKDTDC